MTKQELQKKMASNLLACRLKRNMTQEYLAEKAGLSVSFYTNIENGKRGISLITLMKLSEALQVSTDHLLYGPRDANTLSNLETLLRDRPTDYVQAVEGIVAACVHEMDGYMLRARHDSEMK